MKFKDYKRKARQNVERRNELEKYDLALEIGHMIIRARLVLGMTQKELASLVGTHQPGIARLETGQQLPSLSFLQKIAKAFGTYIIAPRFADQDLNTSPGCVDTHTYTTSINSSNGRAWLITLGSNTSPSYSEEEHIQLNQLQYA